MRTKVRCCIVPSTKEREKYIEKISDDLKRRKENIRLIVLDDVHKVFDRNSEFRTCDDFIKDIKLTFPGISVLALTATLTQEQLDQLRLILEEPIVRTIAYFASFPKLSSSSNEGKESRHAAVEAESTDAEASSSEADPSKEVDNDADDSLTLYSVEVDFRRLLKTP